MSKEPPLLGRNELDLATMVILRVRRLLDACGAIGGSVRPALDRMADLIVSEIASGCVDEDELVKRVVRRYLAGE